MSDALPAGWTTARVEQVIQDFQPGFASGEKNVEGGVAHLRMNNIGLDGELVLDLLRTVPEKLAKSRHDLRRGDVVVCTTNSGKLVGKCAIFDLPGRYVFSNHLTRLRPNDTLVDGRFLRWSLWLQWKSGAFDDQCKHWVNQSTLPKDALLQSEMPLPPLSEQRRIVAKLETLLGKVDACQRRLAKIPRLLTRFRQSVLAAACSGRITADWRVNEDDGDNGNGLLLRICSDRDLDIGSVSGKPLFDAPTSWTWCKLDGLLRHERGLTYGILKPGKFVPDGVPMLRVMDIGDGKLNNTEVFRVSSDLADEFRRTTIEEDDILLAVMATVGRAMVAPRQFVGANVNRALAVVKVSRRMDPQFVCYVIRSPFFQDRFANEKVGSAQQRINLTELREFALPVPPISEQREIVRRVEQLFTFADQIEARFAKAQAHVDKLTQSLLTKAFRGELVPQDPNDEPASALLAHIPSGVNGAEKPARRKATATHG